MSLKTDLVDFDVVDDELGIGIELRSIQKLLRRDRSNRLTRFRLARGHSNQIHQCPEDRTNGTNNGRNETRSALLSSVFVSPWHT